MRRRKEVTMIKFEGVAADGGFVFYASIFIHKIGRKGTRKGTRTALKVISYVNGTMEIAIDGKESIQRVAEVISGMFSEASNVSNLDLVILNYCGIHLQVKKDTGRKNIICMIMKLMSMSDYNGKNEVSVDIQTCRNCIPLRDSDNLQYEMLANYFHFDEIFKWEKGLWFMNSLGNSMIISSIKDGIVNIDCIVDNILQEVKKFFIPYSNFYGVKAVDIEFAQFSIRVDEKNVDRILYLYQRSCDMDGSLYEKELYE